MMPAVISNIIMSPVIPITTLVRRSARAKSCTKSCE
jgi:hypothetical protein